MEKFKDQILSDIELKELNKFGKLELTASHTYLQMSNRMKSLGYFGAEAFFNAESKDERKHYLKIEEFANNLGAELAVETIERPDCECQDLRSALEMAYNMEKDLLMAYEEAARKTDISLKVVLLLQDFTTHQVGAVGEYGDLLARISLTNDMLLFDQELGK